MTGSPWDNDPEFITVADKIRAALGQDEDGDKRARRRAGLEAYRRAMEARGMQASRHAILNAFGFDEDDL